VNLNLSGLCFSLFHSNFKEKQAKDASLSCGPVKIVPSFFDDFSATISWILFKPLLIDVEFIVFVHVLVQKKNNER
jgi:hypothetical protein